MIRALPAIPLLPLIGFVVLVFFGKRIAEPLAGWFATFMVGGSFVAAVVTFAGLIRLPNNTYQYEKVLFSWVPVGDLHVDAGLLIDPVSMTMVLFVTGIAALIHLYSIGYMQGDPRFHLFFTYLNLFVFSMLMLVLGNNMLVTFLGWEGVGACSYFLISFWFTKEANASAGKKAFVTNRVGDWGFLVAMFVTFATFGSLNYSKVLPDASRLQTSTASIIAVMILIAAIGKSAQIPLYIWLPDAMAGPTPVSALIHAATMVTAGVYVMTRMNPVLAASDAWVPWLIAGIGAGTALLAATIGLAQTDIKKVLAYSTISQLGYMFLAVGSAGYTSAIFHMTTHAFFKALLFLGAGSVIHGMHDEQDMRRMGGLRRWMPITFWTMVTGWLAISGIFPFSGFWSKDEILTFAMNKSPVLYGVGLFTALLTAVYMSRLMFLTFWGQPRWNQALPGEASSPLTGIADPDATGDGETATETGAVGAAVAVSDDPSAHPGTGVGDHPAPHESSWLMTAPLVVLAVGAVFAGFLNLPFGRLEFLSRWLEHSVNLEPAPAGNLADLPYSNLTEVLLLSVSFAFALIGIFVAYQTWVKRKIRAQVFEWPIFAKGWYFDIGITDFMGGPGRKIFDAISWFDRTVVDGAVNGVGIAIRGTGRVVRKAQTGYVRTYALGVVFGAVLLMAFVITRVLSLT